MHQQIKPVVSIEFGKAPALKASRSLKPADANRTGGPSTSQGPALKQNLLGQLLSPPKDSRHDDDTFRRIRRALIEEFQPAKATDLLTIELLASDYIQLGRARAMIETIVAPQALSPETEKTAIEALPFQKLNRLVQRTLADCELLTPFKCSEGQARRLASELAKTLKDDQERVRFWLAEDAALVGQKAGHTRNTPSGTEDQDYDEREHERERRDVEELMKLLPKTEAIAKHVFDPAAAVAILTVRRSLSESEREGWCALLKRLADETLLRMRFRTDALEQVMGQYRVLLAGIANNPARLVALEKYAFDLEGTIRRRIRDLTHS